MTQTNPLRTTNPFAQHTWLRAAFPVERLLAEVRTQLGDEVDFNMRDWFPPGDDTAAQLGALAIVREDLALVESNAFDSFGRSALGEDLRPLRRRDLLGLRVTIRALGDAVDTLNQLVDQNKAWREEVGEESHRNIRLTRDFVKEEYTAVIKDHRDELGGHVRWKPIRDGLSEVAAKDIVNLQLGTDTRETHHWYATQLLTVAFVRGVENDDWQKAFSVTARTAAQLSSLLARMIDWVLLHYVQHRGLKAYQPPTDEA